VFIMERRFIYVLQMMSEGVHMYSLRDYIRASPVHSTGKHSIYEVYTITFRYVVSLKNTWNLIIKLRILRRLRNFICVKTATLQTRFEDVLEGATSEKTLRRLRRLRRFFCDKNGSQVKCCMYIDPLVHTVLARLSSARTFKT
jgi:hypothetical protein